MKLKVSKKEAWKIGRKTGKFINMWKLNNTLSKNQWVEGEIKWERRKYLETNANENVEYQKLWDAAKAVLKKKFMAVNAYNKKMKKDLK